TPSPTPAPTPAPTPTQGPTGGGAHHLARNTGIVTKTPRFYKFYTGPKLPELNAVKASAVLAADGSSFTFTGTNKGPIKQAPALYVWGVDRNGNLPPGPFTGRPQIRFDAFVVVSLDSSLTPSARVVDAANGSSTTLPSGSASISGRSVS